MLVAKAETRIKDMIGFHLSFEMQIFATDVIPTGVKNL
jgi:hypothetical protein